jgi:hypothetical protein
VEESGEDYALLETEGSNLCKLAPLDQRCKLNLMVLPLNEDDPNESTAATHDYFTMPFKKLQKACYEGHHQISLRTRFEID